MHIISESTFVEALTHWGVSEVGRRKNNAPPCDPTDEQACLNHILSYRSPYVSRVIERGPVKTYKVAFDIKDIECLLLADSRPIQEWIKDTQTAGGESLEYFNSLVEEPDLIRGHLFCAAKILKTKPLELSTIVIYDGWHRVAAWVINTQQQDMQPIEAYLTITKKEDRFFK